jgi:nicotinamidase-related amidase
MIEPARTALLLMDFQNLIVGMMGDNGPALVGRAQKAREIARARGMAVMHVRVAFSDAGYASIPARNKMFAGIAASRMLPEGSESAQIHAMLTPAPDEEIFTKTRVGAFGTTDLVARLKARGIDTLILTGIATSGVVLSTLREAADRDYHLVVLSDCCGDMDGEVHRILVEKIFPRQADVMTLAAFTA